VSRVTVLAAVAALLAAAPAGAATPAQRIAKLERLVRAQTAQINGLQTRLAETQNRVLTLERNARQSDLTNQCLHALSSDGFHLAWYGVNLLGDYVGFGRLFAPWSPIDDRGACAAIGVRRDPFGYLRR
jgi:uncharacterized coiled-coil protein SlyX